MLTTPATSSLQVLESQLTATDNPAETSRHIPPLENWQPKFCADMDMVIKANGEWWHEGKKVTRESLVNLFSKVLWAELDETNQITYYLKTPVEKLRILVEDAPLLITQVEQLNINGTVWLELATAQGDKVRLDAAHPLRFGLPFSNAIQAKSVQSALQQDQPYILVRQNGDSQLYALIHRNVWLHLVEMGALYEENGNTLLRLQSGAQTFDLTMTAT